MSKDRFDKVQLVQEWAWYCPKCKARNCEEPVIAELSPYERIEMAEEHGIPNAMTGDWLTLPPFVECCECGGEFRVENGRDEGEE